MFQTWLPDIETKVGCLMKTLKVDRKGKFILIKLKAYYKQHSIAIKYTNSYLHKKYSFAKKNERHLSQ